MVDCEEEENT